MVTFFEFTFGAGLLIFGFLATFSLIAIFFSKKRRQMAIAFLTFLILGFGCLLLFGLTLEHDKGLNASNTTATIPRKAVPTVPEYDSNAILKSAERAYKDKNYSSTLVILAELHSADLSKPKAHALWASAKEKQGLEERSSFAQDYENNLLGQGLDATVRAQGVGRKTLYISMPLMSRPLVYQIMHPDAQAKADLAQGHIWKSITDDRTDLLAVWKDKGFTRAIFSDGYDQTWTVNLD